MTNKVTAMEEPTGMTERSDDKRKVCYTCGHVFPISEFRRAGRGRDGYANHCIRCAKRPGPPCTHHRVCGDALISQRFPDFFGAHERATVGSEWQVCLKCGDALLVKVADTSDVPGMAAVVEATRQPVPRLPPAAGSNGHAPVAPLAVMAEAHVEATPQGETELQAAHRRIAHLEAQLARADCLVRLAGVDVEILRLTQEREKLDVAAPNSPVCGRCRRRQDILRMRGRLASLFSDKPGEEQKP